ncbi:sugar-phosphatase [Streptococcus cameli]
MTIKLVAIDLDGTLLNSKKEITPAVFEAIQDAKKAGVKIVITTGRPISGVKQILTDLHLTDPGDYVITFNGGLVQDAATQEDILRETLRYDEYLDIEFTARKLALPLHASAKEGMYTANRNIGKYTMYEAMLVDSPLFYRTPEEMAETTIIKTMMVDEPERLDQKIEELPADFYQRFNISKSAPFYLEITPKTASKGQALKSLATYLGYSISETMAIGDEENDRSMLEMAGCAVVMENGAAALKEIATHITKSNEENGVAYAIREWVLK